MPQTRQQFHEELTALDRQMLHMGTLVSRMMSQAVDSLQYAGLGGGGSRHRAG